jgi:predicted permease
MLCEASIGGLKMTEFNIVAGQVITLFVILIVGFLAGKFNIIDHIAAKKLSGVLLYITSPLLILNSFFIVFSRERLINVLWVVGSSVFMFVFSIIFSKLIFRKFNEKIQPVLRFMVIFSNCGYMGIPLAKAILGDDGAFCISFYVVIFHIFLWTYGYKMYSGEGKQSIKTLLTRPTVLAVFVGMIIFLFHLPVPIPVKNAVQSVGNMTLPLSMLIIGGTISTVKLSAVFNDWKVYLGSFFRLIIMPVIAIFFAMIAKIPPMPASVLGIALSMPAAANTSIFAEHFDKDSAFASKCVTVSTLLSVVTAPFVISLILKFMLI